MKEFQVVTVRNKIPHQWYYLTKQFHDSLKDHPCTVVNYSADSEWVGLTTKPKWLYRAIMEKQIDAKYMIFCDSWDLVFAATPEEIMSRYHSFDGDIVISAERNCFPGDLKDEFDKYRQPTPYKYLNSGFIVGRMDAILTCLEAMDLPNMLDDHWQPEKNCAYHGNDQFEWMKIWDKQPVSINLDKYQSLSQTLHEVDISEFDFSGERIKNILTNSMPCTFHFNGGSKDKNEIRNPILKHLNLL